MWPLISKFPRAAATILLICSSGLFPRADAAPAAAPDLAGLLDQLLPDHRIQQNSLISATGGRAAPAELLGYDVRAGGERLAGKPLSYAEGNLLTFDLYWIPQEAPREKLSVVLRISGSGPTLGEVYPIDTTGWQIGVVSRQGIEFSHVRGWYSGKGALTVALRANGAGPEYVLYTAPIIIRTSNFPSKIDPSKLRGLFGNDLVPLNSAFRIGDGASTSVVPPAGEAKYRALVIVSATGYDGEPVAGEPVCRVKAADCLDATLKTGTDTAPGEPARYDQIGGNKLPAKVFSQDAKSMDYVTVLNFDKPCRPHQIVFQYLKNKGVIDVKEVALLKSNESN
ncbi:MAG: hypothetical protein NTZ09_06630 [Candidatus Hydrogenedentes bacterium]|nr:hypothetical protein [Candidatus Hydrogenedentota bacterium]